MQTLILIQHCQSEHHVNDLTGGWTDTPLTQLGRRQATCLAQRLKRDLAGHACAVYISDLMCAVQTAEIVATELETTPTSVPAIREHHAGLATGRTTAWAQEHINEENFSLFDWAGFPGAETWRQFYARVATWLEHLEQTHNSECLPILVTHGGTVSCIVTWWLKLELDVLPERTPFTGAPGSLVILRRNQYGNPVIERPNDQIHLHDAGLTRDLIHWHEQYQVWPKNSGL